MTKYYKSDFYKNPIEVENIEWEIFVNIITDSWEKIIYSWYDLIDKTSYSPYIKNSLLSSFIWEIPKNILILGFWGWSYAKYFKDYMWENINITWIEIDSSMIEIAKKEFNLNDINYFNLDVKDSIDILNKKKNNKFDTIFIDIYDENSKIPEFFLDENFIKKIINLLAKDSKIIINYANYNNNEKFYLNIENIFLKNLGNKEKIEILNWENDFWNIVTVYNLKEKITSENLILEYLQKVQVWDINYDSNLITNVFLK